MSTFAGPLENIFRMNKREGQRKNWHRNESARRPKIDSICSETLRRNPKKARCEDVEGVIDDTTYELAAEYHCLLA